MQHTETYNLNLIETSDTFSPDPLNQNAQALEDAVEAARAEARAADSALDARLKVFEAKHVKVGMYIPKIESAPMTISLGFTPKVVFAFTAGGTGFGALFSGYSSSTSPQAEIVPGGFRLNKIGNYSTGMTFTNNPYVYLALD